MFAWLRLLRLLLVLQLRLLPLTLLLALLLSLLLTLLLTLLLRPARLLLRHRPATPHRKPPGNGYWQPRLGGRRAASNCRGRG